MLVPHPARRHRGDARRLLRGRRRRRRDRHLRRASPPCSASTASPTRPTSINLAAARIARRWPTSYASRRAPALRGRLDRARAPSSRRSATSASPSCATPTRSRPAACSRAASTCFVIETCFDLLQAKAAMIGCRRAMAAGGRERAAPGAGHDGDDRAHAASAPRSAPPSPPLDGACKPDVLGINCATGPAEMERAPPLPRRSTARCPISVLPNAGLPSVVDGHMHYDLTPDRAGRAPRAASSPSSASQVVGGCCGTTPDAPRRRRRGRAATSSRPAAARRYEPARHVDLLAGADRPGQLVPDHRRAHQRQRLEGVPRGDARRRLGHAACGWPTTRSARAPTCSTSASTTSAATAPPTWTRSPAASPPRPASRSCSTRPSRR